MSASSLCIAQARNKQTRKTPGSSYAVLGTCHACSPMGPQQKNVPACFLGSTPTCRWTLPGMHLSGLLMQGMQRARALGCEAAAGMPQAGSPHARPRSTSVPHTSVCRGVTCGPAPALRYLPTHGATKCEESQRCMHVARRHSHLAESLPMLPIP